MRRLILPLCVIALLALVLSAVQGKSRDTVQAVDAPAFQTVTEAAFSLRKSGAEDATSFLVGNYMGERSGKMIFDGAGQVRQVRKDLSYIPGSYSLMQSADGAAILRMELDRGERLYSFSLASPDGGFTLRDAEGVEETFWPTL